MALLLSCWFIIQSVLIPDGFRKWFCLSYFIHPFFLIFCQVYLWAKFLISTFSCILYYPLKGIWFLIGWVLYFLKDHIICIVFSFRESSSCEVLEEVIMWYDALEVPEPVENIMLLDCSRVVQVNTQLVKVLEVKNDFVIIDKVEEDSNDHVNLELDVPERLEQLWSPELSDQLECEASSLEEEEEEDGGDDEEMQVKEIDQVYQKYTERMRWFDLLNHERTCGISTIGNSSLHQNMEAVGSSLPYIAWSKEAQRMLIRSLETDLELVYVGQTCLCWEALHHQYRKVEALAASDSIRGSFYDNVAGKFQQFQILLERFMEDERNQGKRCLNYVQRRSSLQNFLHVPEVPAGHAEEDLEEIKGQEIFATEAMKCIEKAIRTFWVFVKSDTTKSSWKLTSLLQSYPQVEDPRDLVLLSLLIKTLQKKELELKGLKKSKRWWSKCTGPVDERQRLEIMFAMIEIKLVTRVLKMSVLSTEQLKWCQDKLNNIEFRQGKVARRWSGCLFPP